MISAYNLYYTFDAAIEYFLDSIAVKEDPTELERKEYEIQLNIDNELKGLIKEVPNKLEQDIDTVHLTLALDHIFEIFRRSNKYIDETTPWILAKDETLKDRLETVIYNLLESIRIGAYLLSPFLPETSDKIFKRLNMSNKDDLFNENNEYHLNKPEPLFMRIEVKNE